MPPKNSRKPTARPSRRGPVILAIAELRNMLIAAGVITELEKWTDEIEHFVADQYRRMVDFGARTSHESTTDFRRCQDDLAAAQQRIRDLERELKRVMKLYNEARRGR